MSANRASAKCRFSYIALAVLIIFTAAVLRIGKELNVHIKDIARITCKEEAERIITSAVDATMQKEDAMSLFELIKDENGRIVSGKIDPQKANIIKNSLTSEVEDSLAELGSKGLEIPIGTLTGITLLSGRGKDINITVVQVGTAESDLISTFESAGINNVKLKVTVEVTVTLRMILPTGSYDVTASGEYLIAETVFIGEPPNMYF